ncbi:AVAST type 2 anti-phage system protein Avs2 [Flectobacillus major]|uniref:AVAST type 2 anti-phage system protein Avs2 n=1 Tax=Flectobacillus major TaxID=103 RepID=UPI000419E63F|nr:AVAST type 2 anti-phage system protein Avs2 [Flectobacillus major]
MEEKVKVENSKNVIVNSEINAVDVHIGDKIYNTPKLELNKQWFENLLTKSINNLGERYSEELNFDLPIASVFNGIARNQKFKNELKEKVKIVLNKIGDLIKILKRSKVLNENLSKNIQELESKSIEINNWYKSIKWDDGGSLQYKVINSLINSLLKLVSEIQAIFDDLEALEPIPTNNYQSLKYNDEQYYLRQISTTGYQFGRFLDFNIFQLAERPYLLLSGDGGHGKSHLLADVARNHQSNGGFSILLLGQYFYKGEVWSEIFKQLSISTFHTKDELLTLLNEIGKVSGKRLLFFIDALNEGEGKTIWKSQLSGFLEDFKKYSWLGVIVSVRSTFLSLVVPENLRKDSNTLVHITHQGFRGYEYQASKRFFQYFGLQAPKIPLLTPEFTNPLFLLLFCKGLKKNGYTHIPEGMNGISKIIQFFFQGINKSLFDKFEFEPKINLANKCAESFAQSLSEQKQTFMNYDTAFLLLNNVVKTYFPFVQNCNILTELISEGLFKENVRYNRDNRETECVIEFNYERFGDYIITNLLVDKYIDPKNPSLAFKRNGNLSFVLESPNSYNEGIIEALSVILPEKISKELFEVVPKKYYSVESISHGFIKSLIWRREDTITGKSLEFTDVVQKNGFVREYVEVMISVCSNDKHLFNANHLHKILVNKTLPQRDDVWTTFINSQYSPQVDEEYEIGVIQRLVDWAWSEDNKSYLSEESIYLSAKTVTWFLTSPNRFLRDSSTKGLVCLLTNNLPIACRLIDDFKDINDPYILERLLAGCYGAIVRSEVNEMSKDLAQKVFDTFFIYGEPPVHLLTREYTRGICEFAIHHKLEIIGNVNFIYPPYKSVWEDPKMTAENCVKKYKIKNFVYDTATREDRGQNKLVLSTSDDFYDFNKYEIGRGSEFSAIEINSEKNYNDFYNSLTKNQRQLLNICKDCFKLFLNHPKTTEWEDRTLKILRVAEEYLLKILSESEVVKYKQVARPFFEAKFLSNVNRWNNMSEFSNDKMVSFILGRIFELGWTKELFGSFDSSYDEYERKNIHIQSIGEKYRWIAYYECLARIADNFLYRNRWNDEEKESPLLGAWQIDKRDIDPTITSRPIKIDTWKEYKKTWWFNLQYNNWNHSNWYKKEDDLPNINTLIQVKDSIGRSWVMVQGFPHWKNKEDENEYDDTDVKSVRKELWFHLRSYLI